MSVSQDAFARALLSPGTPPPGGLSDPEGRPAGKRFDVYRNNVTVSLARALETAFPVIRKLLGGERFRALALAYLRTHPPRTPLMMFYGADMPDFLRGFAPLRSLGYLPDIARLELAIRESYHAADAAPVDPARLRSLPPNRLAAARLDLAPALRLVRSPWPIHAIWRFNMEPGAPKPVAEAQDVLVARPGYDPEPQLLPSGGAAVVASLMDGAPLGTAMDAARGCDLAGLLALLLSANAITSLETAP